MAHTEHATEGEEHYLETIFWLEEAGLPITGANIARAQQVSPPTVHEMVGRLERDGFVARTQDKSLAFTERGREHAESVVRRHRLVEHFLMESGLRPELEGILTSSDDEEIAFEADGRRIAITRSVAETVSVAADPSPPPRTALPEQLVLGGRYGR